MKGRIIKVIEKEYGKKITEWYDVQYFKREWDWFIIGLLFPIVGWIMVLLSKPYKLKWRTEVSVDTKKEAKYYLKNRSKYNTTTQKIT